MPRSFRTAATARNATAHRRYGTPCARCRLRRIAPYRARQSGMAEPDAAASLDGRRQGHSSIRAPRIAAMPPIRCNARGRSASCRRPPPRWRATGRSPRQTGKATERRTRMPAPAPAPQGVAGQLHHLRHQIEIAALDLRHQVARWRGRARCRRRSAGRAPKRQLPPVPGPPPTACRSSRAAGGPLTAVIRSSGARSAVPSLLASSTTTTRTGPGSPAQAASGGIGRSAAPRRAPARRRSPTARRLDERCQFGADARKGLRQQQIQPDQQRQRAPASS